MIIIFPNIVYCLCTKYVQRMAASQPEGDADKHVWVAVSLYGEMKELQGEQNRYKP